MKSTFNTYALLFIINHIAFVTLGSFIMLENHLLTPFYEWHLVARAIYISGMTVSFVVMASHRVAKTLNH